MDKNDHLVEVPISLIRESHACFDQHARRYYGEYGTVEGDESYKLSLRHKKIIDGIGD